MITVLVALLFVWYLRNRKEETNYEVFKKALNKAKENKK